MAFIDPDAGASPAPSNFVDPDAQPRGALAEIAAGFKRFTPSVERATGHQESAGKPVDAVTQAALDNANASLQANQLHPEQHNAVVNAIASAPEAVGGFVPMGASQYVGEAAGGLAGPVGATVGGSVAMGGQQYGQRYHEALEEGKQAGLEGDKLTTYATNEARSAAALGAGFGALPVVGGPLRAVGGIVAKAAGFGAKTAAEAGAKTVAKDALIRTAKTVASGTAGLGAYTAASDVATNENKKEAGLPSVTPWQAAMGGLTNLPAASVAFAEGPHRCQNGSAYADHAPKRRITPSR